MPPWSESLASVLSKSAVATYTCSHNTLLLQPLGLSLLTSVSRMKQRTYVHHACIDRVVGKAMSFWGF